VFPDGTLGETSAQQSLAAGFVLNTNIGSGTITADQVSFDATAIGGIQQFVGTTQPTVTGAGTANQQPKDGSTWINTTNLSYNTLTNGVWVTRQWGQAAISAGAISTGQLAAGAITADSGIIGNLAVGNAQIANAAITDAKVQSLNADKITTGTLNASLVTVTNLNASNINTGTLSGDRISGGTIQGSTIVTRGDGFRVRLKDGGAGGTDHLEFLSGANVRSRMFATDLETGIEARTQLTIYNISGGLGDLLSRNIATGAFETTTTEFRSIAINDNTSALAVNVRVNGAPNNYSVVRSTSNVNVKDDLAPLFDDLEDVPTSKISPDGPNVDPFDVLLITPTDFESLCASDGGQRTLGFIAQDVAAKFPFACEYDADGNPDSVADRPIVAGLLAVVRQQQATIEDLSARLDALEA
jgi:hypothetical protein